MGRNEGSICRNMNGAERSFGGYVTHILLFTSVSSHPELELEVHSEGGKNNNKNKPKDKNSATTMLFCTFCSRFSKKKTLKKTPKQKKYMF